MRPDQRKTSQQAGRDSSLRFRKANGRAAPQSESQQILIAGDGPRQMLARAWNEDSSTVLLLLQWTGPATMLKAESAA